MAEYKTIHTTYGLSRLASAEAAGTKINLVEMAVGDGAGNDTTPSEKQTLLVRERFRTKVNRVFQDPADPRIFTAEMIIPASEGGFTLREIGLFDDQGSLFVVGNLPATYKPVEGEGAYSDTTIRLEFVVSNASVVTLQIDPNVAVASQTWVNNTFAKALIIKGGTTNQVLTKDSNEDGEYSWHDPTEAIVVVRSIEENQTLAADQTVVDMQRTTTFGLSVYIEGKRLRAGEWTPDPEDISRLTLAQAYPAGTPITLAQNDPNGTFFDPLMRSQNLADVPDKALARENLGIYSRDEVDARIARIPAGIIAMTAGRTAPPGWLKRNGAEVSRTAYADLFAAIGTTYGEGDGFTTFNLPDSRGLFDRNLDDGKGIDPGRGLGTLQEDQNKEHTHAGSTSTSGGHAHNYQDTDTYETSSSGLSGGNNFTDRTRTLTTSTSGAHAHTVVIEKSGGAEVRVKNQAFIGIIKY